ncbi:MAG: cyclic nucleotide-binding domain-containing protein [Myxococcales bacterium]|nr:cyclic nucleotide-binding domain-containing protein [Myxococcota bacterium]MDW8281759.1 cyclic nucleotide-binding domain-containing protein [Myxococcales bacterium]
MPNRVSGPGERAVQVLFLAIYVGLVVSGFLTDRTESVYLRTTRIFWTMGLPMLPFFMVIFGYYVWRRLCPLSVFAKVGALVPRGRQRRAGPFLERWSYLVIFAAMFVSLELRLIFINGSSLWLAIFLIVLAALAFVTGVIFTGKTWCNFFCPVALIEKVYLEPTGMGRGIHAENSQCSKCTACKKHCPDIDVEMGYWKERELLSRRIATYGWPGLVFAFYWAYYTYRGTWDYYFSGVWTREPDEWRNAFGPGLFFAPQVPKVVGSFLSLLLPTLLSLGVFFALERLLVRRKGRERGIHICLSLAAFCAFNIFYIFAGAPTWREIPGGTWVISFVAVSLSTWFLVRRLPRREEEAVQERFAKRFIARWSWDEKPPQDLREAFYVIKRKEKEKETGLKVYAETIRELLAEGVATRAELRVLEQVRAQFHISDADHERVLAQLKVTDRRLFDEKAALSAEERLQERGYRIALRNLLVRGATRRDVESLRRDYGISPEAHQRIVAEMTGVAGGPQQQQLDLLQRIEDLRAVHRTLHGFLIGPPFEFLSLVLVKRQDRLVDHLLDMLSMTGLGDVIRHHRSQLFDQDKALRQVAIEALRRAGEPAIMQRLVPVLEERVPRSDLRKRIPEIDQERVLDALACDEDPFLRAGAMLASAPPGETPRPSAVERILAGLTDEDPLVREAALQALPLSWGGAQRALSTLLGDADPAVRSAAQAALARRHQEPQSAFTPTDRTLAEQLPELMVDRDHIPSRISGLQSVSSASIGFGPGDTVVTGRFAIPRVPSQLGPVTTTVDRMLFLHCVPLFVDFEPEDLLTLARASEERTVADGKHLVRQGEQGDEIFILMSGRVVVTVQTSAGPEVVTVLGPGDCIGEMSVIDGSVQSATATVQGGPARVLWIAGSTFRRFLEERSHVAIKIIGILSGRLRQIIRRTYAQPPQREASARK